MRVIKTASWQPFPRLNGVTSANPWFLNHVVTVALEDRLGSRMRVDLEVLDGMPDHAVRAEVKGSTVAWVYVACWRAQFLQNDQFGLVGWGRRWHWKDAVDGFAGDFEVYPLGVIELGCD